MVLQFICLKFQDLGLSELKHAYNVHCIYILRVLFAPETLYLWFEYFDSLVQDKTRVTPVH